MEPGDQDKDSKPPIPPKPKLPPMPKPRSYSQTFTVSSPPPARGKHTGNEGAVPKTQSYPKTPGNFYFDGSNFIPVISADYYSNDKRDTQDIYAPGSGFVEVTGPSMPTFMDEYQVRPDDSVSASYQVSGDVEDSRTLQIILNLNISDSKRRQTTNKARDVKYFTLKKEPIPMDNVTETTLEQEKRSNNFKREEQFNLNSQHKTNQPYDNIDEGETDQVTPEQDRPTSLPPAIPPRKKLSVKTESSSKAKADADASSSEDEYGYQKYTGKSPAQQSNSTEATKNLPSFANVDDAITKEVEALKEHCWFFVSNDKKTAKTILVSKQDKPGSFFVLCEKDCRSSIHPFTLCVMKDRKIDKFQIRKLVENGKTKYKLPEENKSFAHLPELIGYYTKQKLPFIDIKLLECTQTKL